ncbi:MAG: preprotein translocase subunit SecE [Candidatus Limnocylindrales bacterium]
MDRIRGLFSRARRFVDEDWSELKKVSWPTVPQTRNLTVLVFTVSFVVMLFIAFWDTIFLNAIKLLSGNG